MRALSLFTGIGGLDLGCERVGIETVAYCEVDPYCLKVLERRFPKAASLGSVVGQDWNAVNVEHGPFDVIIGGFPCQDVSTQGRGVGLDGERSGLWWEYAEAIRVLRPDGVIVENVRGLTNRGLDAVLWSLADIGYDAEWDCVPASAFGAPHQRDRLFVLAYPIGLGLSGPWEYEPSRHPAPDAFGEAGDVVDAVREGALPYVCRRHDGAASRLERDRVRALGNAVVPQVAEFAAGVLLERLGVANAG